MNTIISLTLFLLLLFSVVLLFNFTHFQLKFCENPFGQFTGKRTQKMKIVSYFSSYFVHATSLQKQQEKPFSLTFLLFSNSLAEKRGKMAHLMMWFFLPIFFFRYRSYSVALNFSCDYCRGNAQKTIIFYTFFCFVIRCCSDTIISLKNNFRLYSSNWTVKYFFAFLFWSVIWGMDRYGPQKKKPHTRIRATFSSRIRRSTEFGFRFDRERIVGIRIDSLGKMLFQLIKLLCERVR